MDKIGLEIRRGEILVVVAVGLWNVFQNTWVCLR